MDEGEAPPSRTIGNARILTQGERRRQRQQRKTAEES